MKKIDQGEYTYKGYNIYFLEHPKLFGKYEIYRNDEFVLRVRTLQEAKEIINFRVNIT